jgi:hypothetical protein
MTDADDKARLKKAKARATKARKFMVNTCPASRHAHMMADTLAKGKVYHMFTEEPEYCAETLYSVITSLWEARDKPLELQGYWWKPETPAEHRAQKLINEVLRND